MSFLTVPYDAREAQLAPDERPTRSFGPLAFGVAAVIAVACIIPINPSSILNLFYYFILWSAFILAFHRDHYRRFALAFAVNSAFAALYIMIQSYNFPSSYGTTSPFGSWTDDSFFFSLVADRVPAGMELRPDYDLYSSPFSSIIRALSFLPIYHPLDVIFFQSGTAAALSTFLRRFVIQKSDDARLGNTAYMFATLCPFLMMNGGVILIRDVAAAALFIYALSCFNIRQWPLALGANVLEIAIRPGTAVILLPAYAILLLPDLKEMNGRRFAALAVGLPVLVLGGFAIGAAFIDLASYQGAIESVSLGGRQTFDDLRADAEGNQIFLAIQNMPYVVRFVLNGAYMFLYPIMSFRLAFPASALDVRAVLMNLIIPLENFWLNAWFIAGALTKPRVARQQTQIVTAVLATLLVLGTYSLQTRHKTIIYPLYYFVVAIGFSRAGQAQRRTGYAVSGSLILLQVVANLR